MFCIVLKLFYLCAVNLKKGNKNEPDQLKQSTKIFKNKTKVMKKQTSNLFTSMSNTAVENLVKEVKETLASGYNINQHKPFTSIDMWNIHRQRKTMGSRRQFC